MKNRVASSGQLRALVRQNIRLAKRLKSGQLGVGAIDRLRDLTKKFGFSFWRWEISNTWIAVGMSRMGASCAGPTSKVYRDRGP